MTSSDSRDLFDKAIEKSKESRTIKLFIPFNLWSDLPGKDKWLDYLVNFDGKVTIIYGKLKDNPTEKEREIYNRRVKKLINSDIDIIEIPSQENAVYGLIIFDNYAFCGIRDLVIPITNREEIEFLNFGFEGLIKEKYNG